MITDFVRDLLDARPARVGPDASVPTSAELADALSVLERFEAEYRQELPGPGPAVCTSAAAWALKSFYLGCALTAHRDAGAEAIDKLLSDPGPDPGSPENHYSVDLVFRFLPDLVKLAESAANEDPLLAVLYGWGRTWPLSSVGIAGVGEVDATAVMASPTLGRMYVDRVLAASDVERLDNDRVEQETRSALGDYPSLSPSIAKALDAKRNRKGEATTRG